MTSPQTGNREFRNEVIRIAEMTVTSPRIEGYSFVNCKILGPAVLALVDATEIRHCTFEADVNAVFWEVDPAVRPLVFGAVGVSNCSFVSCSFEGIGFAGTQELRSAMEAAINQ